MSAKVLMTEAEFDALEEYEGGKRELDEGELVMTASPYLFHNRVRDYLAGSLASYAKAQKLGEVTSETDFRLAAGLVRIPDIAFIRRERLAVIDPRQRLQGAPDLAVEVISPSNSARDLARKVRQYLNAGASAVWVVYPEDRFAHIYRAGMQPEIREADQTLDAPELLPGWHLPLAELFAAAEGYFGGEQKSDRC